MDSLNIERRSLLLELIRDIIQNNIPGYNDKAINSRINKYLNLIKKFENNPKDFDLDEQLKLNKLHKYFYGTNFNFEDPDENDMTISTNIYEEFKRVFKKIADLAESPNILYEELMKSLNSILVTVGALTNEKQVMEYLNLINSTIQRHQSTYTSPEQKITIVSSIKEPIREREGIIQDPSEYKPSQKLEESKSSIEDDRKERITALKELEARKKLEEDKKKDELRQAALVAENKLKEDKERKELEYKEAKEQERLKLEAETANAEIKLQERKELKDADLEKKRLEDEERRRLKELLEKNKEEYAEQIGEITPDKLEELLENLTKEKLEEENIKTRYDKINKIKHLIIYYCYLVKFYNITHNYELNILLTIIKNNLDIQQINYIDMTENETPKIKELLEKNKEIIDKYLRNFIKEYINLLNNQTKVPKQSIINKIRNRMFSGTTINVNEEEEEQKQEEDKDLTLKNHKKYLVDLLELLFKITVEKHHAIYLYEEELKYYDILNNLTKDLFGDEYSKKLLEYIEFKIKQDLEIASEKINLGGIVKGGGITEDINEHQEAVIELVKYNLKELKPEDIESKINEVREIKLNQNKDKYLELDIYLTKLTDEKSDELKEVKDKTNIITFKSSELPSISSVKAERIKKIDEIEISKVKIDLLENEDYLFFMEFIKSNEKEYDKLIQELNNSYKRKGFFSKFKTGLKNISNFSFKDKTKFIDFLIQKLKNLLETNKEDFANILFQILNKIKEIDITNLDKVIRNILEEIIDKDEIINGKILFAICSIKYFNDKINNNQIFQQFSDKEDKDLYYNFLLKYIKYKKDFLDLLTNIIIEPITDKGIIDEIQKIRDNIVSANTDQINNNQKIPKFFGDYLTLYQEYLEFLIDKDKVKRFNEEVSKVKPKTLFNRITGQQTELSKLNIDIYLENKDDEEKVKKLLNIDISKDDYELTEKLKAMIKEKDIIGLKLEDFKTINELIENYDKQKEYKNELIKIKKEYAYYYELEQLFIKDLYNLSSLITQAKIKAIKYITFGLKDDQKIVIKDQEKLFNLLYYIYKFHTYEENNVLNFPNDKDNYNDKIFLLMSLLMLVLKYDTNDIPDIKTDEINIKEILVLLDNNETYGKIINDKLKLNDYLKDKLEDDKKKDVIINYLLLLCKTDKITNSEKISILKKVAELTEKTEKELIKEYNIKLDENIDINILFFDEKFIEDNRKTITIAKDITIKDFLKTTEYKSKNNYDNDIKPLIKNYLFSLINKKNKIIPEIIEILFEIYNLESNTNLILSKDYFIDNKDNLEYKFIVLYTLLFKKNEKELKKLFDKLEIDIGKIEDFIKPNYEFIKDIENFFIDIDTNLQEYKEFQQEFIRIYYFGLPKHSKSIEYEYDDKLFDFLIILKKTYFTDIKDIPESIANLKDKIKYYLGQFNFKLHLIIQEIEKTKSSDVIEVFKIIYSLKQILLKLKDTTDKKEIEKYRNSINEFFENYIEKVSFFNFLSKTYKFKIKTDNILTEIKEIISNLLYQYLKTSNKDNILIIIDDLKIINLIINLYNELFLTDKDNKQALIDIIYDKKDITKIQFIIEYLFNFSKLIYVNEESLYYNYQLYGIILNNFTKIEEILCLYFEKNKFDKKKFEIDQISKYILYILLNKLNNYKFGKISNFNEYLLIFLNLEYLFIDNSIIDFNNIKKLGNIINKNYKQDYKFNNFDNVFDDDYKLTTKIFLYAIHFTNYKNIKKLLDILDVIDLAKYNNNEKHLSFKFLICYIWKKTNFDNILADTNYKDYNVEQILLDFFKTDKINTQLFFTKNSFNSQYYKIINIIFILYYKNNITYPEHLYDKEFSSDIIKSFKNFIIIQKQINNDKYKWNLIQELINILYPNFTLPNQTDNLEIPVSVKDNLDRKKELLNLSIRTITDYDQTLSDEHYLNTGGYIFNIIQIYNSRNLKTNNLLELLKDLDDFTDYHLSVKYLIDLFYNFLNSEDFDIRNIFTENTDLISYDIENKLINFIIIYNTNIKVWFDTHEHILKFILFILLLKTNNKKDIYTNYITSSNIEDILLQFIYLHKILLKENKINFNFIKVINTFLIPISNIVDQKYLLIFYDYIFVNETIPIKKKYDNLFDAILNYNKFYLNNNTKLSILLNKFIEINEPNLIIYLLTTLWYDLYNTDNPNKYIDRFDDKNNLDIKIKIEIILLNFLKNNNIDDINFIFKNNHNLIINFIVFIFTYYYKNSYQILNDYDDNITYTINNLDEILRNNAHITSNYTDIDLLIGKINDLYGTTYPLLQDIPLPPPPRPPRPPIVVSVVPVVPVVPVAGFGGGNKANPISITNVFKLYYNVENEANTNSIYKLYFLLNLFGYYYDDQQLLLELIKIIELNKYTEEVKEIIKQILNKIFEITMGIFNDYIKFFNETDSIIKNYYLDIAKLKKYLYINFIYDIYKNIELQDINFNVNINNIEINIIKTNQEIKNEILKLISDNDFIFNKQPIKITNQFPNSDLNNFIHIIYDFTSKSNITIDNMNELNAYIVIQLLSSNDDIILSLNKNNYKIENFRTSAYKILKQPTMEFSLNKNQMELYDYLLKPENYNKLVKFLRKDYYYISLDITKDYKYKFNINSEIMDLIDEEIKKSQKSLITYPENPISIHIKMLEILEIKENKLQSLVYYGIYLTAGIFMKSSVFNFISLVYVYSILKNSTFEFIGDYKDLLDFFENVLKLMLKQLGIKKDINNFIRTILNFKGNNKYIDNFDSQIKLDTNFLKSLYNSNKEIKIEDLFEDYIKTFQILFVYLIDNANNSDELQQLINYYFITILWGFKETGKITEDLEKMVIDLNAKLNKMIIVPQKITGGGSESQNYNKPLLSQQLPPQPQQPQIKPIETKNANIINEEEKEEFVKKLNFINNFIKEFNEFNNKFKIVEKEKDGIIKTYNDIIAELNHIKDPKDDSTIMSIKQIDYPNNQDTDFGKKIAKIKSQISENVNNVKDYIAKYNTDVNEPKKEELITLKKLREDYDKIIKSYIPYFDKYKTSNDVLVKNIIGMLKKKDEDDKDYIFDIIKNFLKLYDNIIKEFKDQLNKTKSSLDSVINTIKDLENKYNVYVGRGQQRREESRNDFIMGGATEDNSSAMQNTNKFKEFDKLIQDLKDKNIGEKINKLETGIKKIKSSTSIKDNSNKDEVEKIGIDTTTANLFERLLNQYDNDSKTTIPEIAKAKLYDKVVDNNLDPEIELEITFYDKLIFIFVVIIIRLIAVNITYYFIDNNTITTIQKAIQYYAIIYVLIFLVIFMIINIDVFRLRLIFNFMNMHINSTGILIHILLKIIISYIVYLLIINIDDKTKPTRLSKHQKIKLKFKFDVLTITILVFLSIFILVI